MPVRSGADRPFAASATDHEPQAARQRDALRSLGRQNRRLEGPLGADRRPLPFYALQYNITAHNLAMDWMNRTAELARLDRLLGRRDGSLAVIWGRRRIGKTRLLVEWTNRSSGVYFVGDTASAPDQRRRLAESLATRLPGFADVDYRD